MNVSFHVDVSSLRARKQPRTLLTCRFCVCDFKLLRVRSMYGTLSFVRVFKVKNLQVLIIFYVYVRVFGKSFIIFFTCV